MEKGPRDGERVGDEAGVAPQEQPFGAPEEARDTKRKGSEDAGWMSMVDEDPALFIKGSE